MKRWSLGNRVLLPACVLAVALTAGSLSPNAARAGQPDTLIIAPTVTVDTIATSLARSALQKFIRRFNEIRIESVANPRMDVTGLVMLRTLPRVSLA